MPSAHEKLNISLPSVKYFVIPFVGSAAQHGLGFFLGLFLCLCALDRTFDSIVGKFYVRMLSQVELICCGCLFWRERYFKMSAMGFEETITVGFQVNSL